MLADERRATIVDELRRAPDGLDVQELARRLGLHPNTIRWHLGVLRDAGAITAATEPSRRPGRPRLRYHLRPGVEPARGDEYRLLATILSGTLAEDEDGRRRAAEAGRAWGRYLVERPPPLTQTTDDEATARVTALLDEQGFAAESADGEIRMRRCPFHDLAAAQPEIVCAVHRGLVTGALEELGSSLELAGLDVLVRPDLCVARLARRA